MRAGVRTGAGLSMPVVMVPVVPPLLGALGPVQAERLRARGERVAVLVELRGRRREPCLQRLPPAVLALRARAGVLLGTDGADDGVTRADAAVTTEPLAGEVALAAHRIVRGRLGPVEDVGGGSEVIDPL